MTTNQVSDAEKKAVSGERKARSRSLRSRLLVAFILLATLPVAVASAVAGVINVQGLRAAALETLDSVAELKSDQISDWVSALQTDLALVSQDSDFLGNLSLILSDSTESYTAKREIRSELLHQIKVTGNFQEVFAMDQNGTVLVSTNTFQEGKIFSSQTFYREGLKATHVTPPLYDVSSSTYSIVFTQPIRDENGVTLGVLAGRANLSVLSKILAKRAGLGETGETYLIGSNYAVLTKLRFTESTVGETYLRTDGTMQAVESKRTGSASYDDYRGISVLGSYRWIPDLQIALIAEHDTVEALAAANRALMVTGVLILITLIIAAVLSIILTRTIVEPISQLVSSAEKIASGNLDVNAAVHSQDEIGALASAFNTMTARLRELVGTLEQRIADRTKAIAASSEVSRRISTILDQTELVHEVVTQVNNAFGYYHTQVYFFDAARENLVMAGGTGEAGRLMLEQFHKVRRGNGLVGRAAESNQLVFVPDTSQNPEWLPNILLPDTRAELAIPIAIGDHVLGVLDIQHNVPNGLNQEDVDSLVSIANQVAVALQNARSYTETQRSQALLSEALSISRLANWEYDVEHDTFTFNDQFYAIFRTSVEKVGSYKLSSAEYARLFVHPEDAPLVGAEIQKVMTSTQRRISTSVEHRTIFENGEIGYISVNVSVDRDENGKIVSWSGANQDITERRRLEEINRKRAFQQESINTVTQKIQSATNVEMALQIAARELGHVLGKRQTLVSLNPETTLTKEK